jgi:hypothetical protein
MRLSELNIREDDLDDAMKDNLNRMGLRVNPDQKPAGTAPSKTDTAKLGKKVDKVSNAGKASKVKKIIGRIPVIGGPFRIGVWIGAAQFARWATDYYNYVVGWDTRNDGTPSPCELGKSYKAATDTYLDPFIRDKSGSTLGSQLSDKIFGALPGVVGAIVTQMTVARTVAGMLRVIAPAGGLVGFGITLIATAITGFGAYMANKLSQKLSSWGRPFTDLVASTVMMGIGDPFMINRMCDLGNFLGKPNESVVLESNAMSAPENQKRLNQIGKVFQEIINETKNDFKENNPKAYKKFMKLVKRAERKTGNDTATTGGGGGY